MKKCPQCQTNYYDNMLDFCLEDGARLFSTAETAAAGQVKDQPPERPPQTTVFREAPKTDQSTVAFSAAFTGAPEIETIVVDRKKDLDQEKNQEKNQERSKNQKPLPFDPEKIKHSAIGHWTNFLETAPIVIALAHNYWQWLYLAKLSYGGFLEYFLSSSFLIWLLLLLGGLALSLVSLKFAENRKFAVASLVVLAINVLLYIVPK